MAHATPRAPSTLPRTPRRTRLDGHPPTPCRYRHARASTQARARAAETDALDSGEVEVVPPDLDAVAAAAWAATVVITADVQSKLPGFMSSMLSSRHGSGVVVSPDGCTVLTAAHVACMAGPRNRLRLRAPAAGGEWMPATVGTSQYCPQPHPLHGMPVLPA